MILFLQATTVVTKKVGKKPEAWEKSVGGFQNKKSLKNLVKKKKIVAVIPKETVTERMSENSEKSSTKEGEKKISLPPWNDINQDSSDKKPVANGTVNTGSSNSALGMLGSYSDSHESE